MKIKTSQVTTVLLLGILLLTGCSSQNTSHNSSSKKVTTTTVSHKKVSSIKSSKELWNSDKDAKLTAFINQWAPTMNQSYVKYDGNHSLKTSTGATYPDELKHVTVEGNKASIGWNKTDKGNYEYNVVAIYNYDGTKPPLPNHITYFFAFHNGKPIVLVDQSTNGTPDLLATQNTALKSGFENIVNSKKTNVSSVTTSSRNDNNANTNNSNDNNKSNSDSTQSVSDPKMVGVMLYELDRNFDISGTPNLQINIANGRYWIGTGSSNSTLPYTIEGNTAHYWTVLYTGNDIRPDGTTGPSPETEHTISLDDLAAKYYSTDDQKQELDQVTSQIPDIE